jgi:transcriptional regulator with XRE-family HTH domain
MEDSIATREQQTAARLLRIQSACAGASLRQLATLAGVSKETIRRYRAGECTPSMHLVGVLCEHFDLSGDWLLCGIGPQRRSQTGTPCGDTLTNDELLRLLAARLTQFESLHSGASLDCGRNFALELLQEAPRAASA